MIDIDRLKLAKSTLNSFFSIDNMAQLLNENNYSILFESWLNFVERLGYRLNDIDLFMLLQSAGLNLKDIIVDVFIFYAEEQLSEYFNYSIEELDPSLNMKYSNKGVIVNNQTHGVKVILDNVLHGRYAIFSHAISEGIISYDEIKNHLIGAIEHYIDMELAVWIPGRENLLVRPILFNGKDYVIQLGLGYNDFLEVDGLIKRFNTEKEALDYLNNNKNILHISNDAVITR